MAVKSKRRRKPMNRLVKKLLKEALIGIPPVIIIGSLFFASPAVAGVLAAIFMVAEAARFSSGATRAFLSMFPGYDPSLRGLSENVKKKETIIALATVGL